MTTDFEEILELYEYGDAVIVDGGEWEQDGKYQHCTITVEYNGKYYCINQSRSGSYHTDWYYDEPTICEVVKKERVITQVYWESV